MPNIPVNDIDLYYEISGAGEALLLIAGLNGDHTFFERTALLGPLAAHNRVIVFDNRGAGRSSMPDVAYTVETMAADAAGLLDALGVSRAQVLGISLGGRIALALALSRPDLVHSLVLVSAGARTQLNLRQRLLDLQLRIPFLRRNAPYYSVARQRDASRSFDATGRLGEVRAPTLILQGQGDRLAPPSLAREMQAGIRDARLQAFPGGHLFFIFRRAEFLETIRDFIDRHPIEPAAAR